MVYYFTGTGNSYHVARVIAEAQGERLLSVARELDNPDPLISVTPHDGERVGFVFPIHAWGPPRLVLDLIRRLRIAGKPYIFTVCTCGDEEGHATRAVQKAVAKQGLALSAAFCLIMPNNYIVSFTVDPPDLAAAKIKDADEQLVHINAVLRDRQQDVFELRPGKQPGLKSALINPLFNRFACRTGKFFAEDTCTRCGLCERICPVHTITLTDKPRWGKACTQCLGCLHRCPVQAIQYGAGTRGKARYVFPEDLPE
jgi:NAD-dependent dihydropyrimidine dehydrogenase PreA subunit